MTPDKMVRMANQIAIFFKTQPGADASARVHDHIMDFWEPRMRAKLREHVQQGGAGLDPIALQAAQKLI